VRPVEITAAFTLRIFNQRWSRDISIYPGPTDVVYLQKVSRRKITTFQVHGMLISLSDLGFHLL